MIDFWLAPMRLTLGFLSIFGGMPERNQALVRQVGYFELLAWDQHQRFISLLRIPTLAA